MCGTFRLSEFAPAFLERKAGKRTFWETSFRLCPPWSSQKIAVPPHDLSSSAAKALSARECPAFNWLQASGPMRASGPTGENWVGAAGAHPRVAFLGLRPIHLQPPPCPIRPANTAPSSAPVCALGHLPPRGKAREECGRRNAPAPSLTRPDTRNSGSNSRYLSSSLSPSPRSGGKPWSP